MKTITALLRSATAFLFFLFTACSVYSQKQTFSVERQWVRSIGRMDTLYDAPVRVAYDSKGNVIIAGNTIDTITGTDFLTARYSPTGNLLWQKTYNSYSNWRDEATGVAVGDSDNIFVVGYADSSLAGDFMAYMVLKYDSAAAEKSSQFFYSKGYNIPAAIVVDTHSVFFSGGGIIDLPYGLDYTVVALDEHTGATHWGPETYDYADLYDAAPAIALDTYHHGVVVTGGSQATVSDMDFATLWYDTNGVQTHTQRAPGTGTAPVAGGLAVKTDTAGNVYVTGMIYDTLTGYDIKTIKYDHNANQIWNVTFNYEGLNDAGHDLLVDAIGNVYVCGQGKSLSADNDYILLKYNSGGTLIWHKSYDGAGGNDSCGKMCFDRHGNVVLTGQSMTADGNFQFLTVAYDTAGNVLWKDYFGGCSGDSKGLDIKADTSGNIYVAGSSYNCDSAKYMNTVIKYADAYYVVPPDTEADNTNMLFYPNYGQIVDTAHTVRMDVFYYTINQNPKIYFDTAGVSFVFAKCDSDTTTHTLRVDTLERIDMSFIQSETTANMNNKPYQATIHDNPYLNYFLAQCPNGIVNVKGSEILVQKKVFPGIDVVYGNNGAGMKFYFVVYPGGDPSNLILHFAGQQSLAITSGNLYVNGLLNTFEYLKPQVYQIDTNNTRIALGWTASYLGIDSYDIGINIGGGTYNHSLPLVIECERQAGHSISIAQADNMEYSTYYGDIAAESANNTRTDKHTGMHHGETYIVGQTESANLPITNTGIQPNIGGMTDAFVYKMHYDSTNRYLAHMWATYYGGSGGDVATDVATNSIGDVYFVGSTNSPDTGVNKFFTLNSTHGGNYNQSLLNQGNNLVSEDGFIVRLDSLGHTRLWSTYFGGYSDEDIKSITIDANDNVYITGLTQSDSAQAFPLKSFAGGFNQTAYGGNISDAFVARFNINDSIFWSIYFGGNGADDFWDVRVSADNHTFITGFTESAHASVSNWNAGTHQCPYVYGHDLQLCDHGGTAYQQTYGNGHPFNTSDLLIVEFDDSCRLQWSTYFGGNGAEEPGRLDIEGSTGAGTAFDLYVVGSTTDSTSFPFRNLSGSYYQDYFGYGLSAGSAVIARFTDRQPVWATLFGFDDWATGVVFQNNILYVAGWARDSAGGSVNTSNVTCNAPDTAGNPFPICDGFSASGYIQLYNGTDYYGGGQFDGFIAAFGINDALGWSTFIGGDGDDQISGIAVSDAPYEALYTTGYSTSSASRRFPYLKPSWANPAAVQLDSNYSGNTDVVIQRFNAPNIVTGITEKNNPNTELIAYPNPASGKYELKGVSDGLSAVSVKIFDTFGKQIKNYTLPKQKGEFNITIDLSEEANGMYAILAITKNGSSFTKVIKQN